MATPPRPPAAPDADRGSLWPCALIVALACCAWWNAFSGPFVFDDLGSITDNATIRQLWPPDWAWPPAGRGETVGGRPLLNLSFALNHAAGGLAVEGWHATNLALHVLAALTLFGLLRRSLRLPSLPARIRLAATPLATTAAALWAVHPLQTAAVSYVVQRAETLAALFYLLVLYALVRAAQPGAPRRWSVLCVGACALGLLCKETVATAPLVALLFDRTFLAGSFAAAWRARRRLHLALFANWLLLAALLLGNPDRGGSVGAEAGTGTWPYLLTQCDGLVHYLRLAFWPRGLTFDYGTAAVRDAGSVLPQAALLLLLGAATLVALVRRPALGFLGACWFLILAPSSSFVPVATEVLAEHRMVLPLAAVVLGAVLLLHRLLGRAAFALLAALAVAAVLATRARNDVYRDELLLWQDTLAQRPDNPRAFNNAGRVLLERGRPAEAIPLLQRALEINPHTASAPGNLGNALRLAGHAADAVAYLRPVVAADPSIVANHLALGNALADLRRTDEAIAEYREALRLAPDALDVRTNLAALLLAGGGATEAIALLQEVVARDPSAAEARYHLGVALVGSGHAADGIAQLREAVRLRPAMGFAQLALGDALAASVDLAGAIDAYRRALAADPAQIAVRNNLANALVRAGRVAEAIPEYEAILRAQPDNVSVRHNLDYARQLQAGKP